MAVLNFKITKTRIGLGNVDNTSDADKPISTAQDIALNSKQSTASNILTASGIAETYPLVTNIPTIILNSLPAGVNSSITLPVPNADIVNESVLHFKTGSVLPTIIYSGFTPVWLGGTAISMKINKTYSIIFEQIKTETNTWIVKTSWGEY